MLNDIFSQKILVLTKIRKEFFYQLQNSTIEELLRFRFPDPSIY